MDGDRDSYVWSQNMDRMEEIMPLQSNLKQLKDGKKIKVNMRGVSWSHLQAIKHKIAAQKKKMGLK